jgi:hypothetical protein
MWSIPMTYLPVELRINDAEDFEAGDYYACPELREAVNAVLGDEKGKGLFKLYELSVIHWSNGVRACARKALWYWWSEDQTKLQVLREQIETQTQQQIEKARTQLAFFAQGEEAVVAPERVRSKQKRRIAPLHARGARPRHRAVSGDPAKQRAL